MDGINAVVSEGAVAHAGEVIHKMAREKYDRLRRLNFSKLKHMKKSPFHYQHEELAPPNVEDDTDARKLGRAVHLAVLEPQEFGSRVAVWDGGRRAGKEWEKFCAANEGLEILRQEDYRIARAVQAAVRSSPAAQKYLEGGGSREATVLWNHVVPAVGGLPGFSRECKGRVDLLTDTHIIDLKTSRDISPEKFGRDSFAFSYHVQAAYYVDGVKAATGRELPYVILAVENSEPYAVQPYIVPPDILDLGREEYRAWMGRLQICEGENRWPGYADGELELTLPRWARPSDGEEDLTGLGLTIGGE
jgi:hypothetical protein